MHITTLKIKNYKSFWESDEIPFETGFNLIVGQNDAGKSALLESLRPGMVPRPHRSLLTAPEIRTPSSPNSTTSKQFQFTGADIKSYLSSQSMILIKARDSEPQFAVDRFNQILTQGGIFEGNWVDMNFASGRFTAPAEFSANVQYHYPNTACPLDVMLGALQGIGGGQNFNDQIGLQIPTDIYAFNAERYRMGACPANGNRVLASDASNLPEVLNKLAEDPATEKELLAHVKTIFPHVKHVASTLEAGNTAHVRIWTHDISTKRVDLAIPLADSGSGIGQVLAMLYVVVTADRPKVILIDEPQSFLHPGAVRKLFEILNNYSQHQYMVTTHSPSGLAITGAANMLLVKRGVEQSTVVRLDPSSQAGVKIFLSDVGARLSDVYGADNIMWVEGKTEECCFPILIRDVAKRMIRGTQILGVVNTGDLDKQHADRVITIYQRLSGAASVLPPALAFIFDQEGRSKSEQEDISRRGHGLVKWLPRRMYENYLIDCDAISQVINKYDETRIAPVSALEVDAWLQKNGSSPKLLPKSSSEAVYGSEEWIEKVHAGNVLKELFGEMTDQRVHYDKVLHGEQLTKFISINPSESTSKLAEFLASLLIDV